MLQAMGDVLQFRGDRDGALAHYADALKLFRAIGAQRGEANVLAAQGQLFLPDNLTRANELLNQAIEIYSKIGSHYSIPAQIGNFGWKLWRLDEKQKAKPYLTQAADLFEQIGLLDYAERHRNAANQI